MSELTDARTTWDAKQSVLDSFFLPNGEPDPCALGAHRREGDVILLAESIASGNGWDASTTNRPVDAGMIAEAEALAAAE